ncbi:hypothetical protein Q5O24_02155 [Eubacteriaceae bacterium ES3]|nr:hypothetical protein Q5O24_02155 [Eubacteriaceae bacterium ES3]
MTWEEADLKKEGWEKAFDLVFASMSPAINGPEDLLKMIEASRNFCFMSSHLYKKDLIGEELKDQFHLNNRKANYRKNLYYAFNILWEKGYFAEFTHQDYARKKTWKLESAFNYYKQILEGKEEQDKLKEYLKKKCVDGLIEDANESKNGWLFWSVLDQKGT